MILMILLKIKLPVAMTTVGQIVNYVLSILMQTVEDRKENTGGIYDDAEIFERFRAEKLFVMP